MCRELDPEGIRTIGVLTKCDRLESQDIKKMLRAALEDKNILKTYGYRAIINASEQDILENKTMQEVKDKEEDWFRSKINEIGEEAIKKCTSTILSSDLTSILGLKIENRLPEIKKQLEKQSVEYKNELENYGEKLNDNQIGKILLSL